MTVTDCEAAHAEKGRNGSTLLTFSPFLAKEEIYFFFIPSVDQCPHLKYALVLPPKACGGLWGGVIFQEF